MPDRFDRAVVGRAVGRGRPVARDDGDGVGRPPSRPPRRADSRCCSRRPSTGRRTTPATSRAIRRACARTAASTATPRCGRSSPSRELGDGRRGGRAVLAAQPDQPRAHAGPRATATRSSRTSSRPTSTRWRRTSGAAAGPGTPARPAGCTAPASRASSASAAKARCWCCGRASRRPGRASRPRSATTRRDYAITVRRDASGGGAMRATCDDAPLAAHGDGYRLPLDGGRHVVVVLL